MGEHEQRLSLDALTRQLQTTGEVTQDRGNPLPFSRLTFGGLPNPTTLDISGETGRIRAQTARATVELYLPVDAEPELSPAGVVFESHTAGRAERLEVSADGTITFVSRPVLGAAAPGAERVSPAPDASAAAPAKAEKSERFTGIGRLQRNPVERDVPSGKRFSFTLVVHEDGKAVYHDVYATKQYAQRLISKGLQKGDVVEITGGSKQVQREQDRKTKEWLDKEYVYCFGLKLVARRQDADDTAQVTE